MIVLTVIWQDSVEQYMGINMEGIKARIQKEMQSENLGSNAQSEDRLNRYQSYLDVLSLTTHTGRLDIQPGDVNKHTDPRIIKIMRDRLLSYWPYLIINYEE